VPHKRHLHWPLLPTPWQSKRHAPHAWAAMGRGRVDPAPPAPINNDPKGRKGGEKNCRKQEGRPRERQTDSVEREGTETIGISTGRSRATDGEKEEKGIEGANRQRGEDTDWCLYAAERKHRRCHRASHSPPPQRHREQSPASPSAQPSKIIASGNSSPPHSRRSLFIFLPAERAQCTFCMQEE
jgi:hypothetical protein